MGLLASVGMNLGQNIQNTNRFIKLDDHDLKKRLRRRAGVCLFVVSAIANFVSFSFAPASVLAPLEGVQFVTNFVYALSTRNTLLYSNGGEGDDAAGWRWDAVWRTGRGTFIVFVGITLPITVATSEVAVFDRGAIWCLWRGTAWWSYFVGTSCLALGCFLLYRRIRPPI
eukprot:2721920-Prymnesium_polylepis.1